MAQNKKSDSGRKDRLAKALRANLKRRKAQTQHKAGKREADDQAPGARAKVKDKP